MLKSDRPVKKTPGNEKQVRRGRGRGVRGSRAEDRKLSGKEGVKQILKVKREKIEGKWHKEENWKSLARKLGKGKGKVMLSK